MVTAAHRALAGAVPRAGRVDAARHPRPLDLGRGVGVLSRAGKKGQHLLGANLRRYLVQARSVAERIESCLRLAADHGSPLVVTLCKHAFQVVEKHILLAADDPLLRGATQRLIADPSRIEAVLANERDAVVVHQTVSLELLRRWIQGRGNLGKPTARAGRDGRRAPTHRSRRTRLSRAAGNTRCSPGRLRPTRRTRATGNARCAAGRRGPTLFSSRAAGPVLEPRAGGHDGPSARKREQASKKWRCRRRGQRSNQGPTTSAS